MYRVLFLAAAATAACSFDPAGTTGAADVDASANIDAGPGAADAAAPDAAPVACTSPADCATPPDLCHRPGQCNLGLGICQFPPVDCAGLGDLCNAGVCNPATGTCETTPANDGAQCDEPTLGGFNACSFAAPCDLDGSQSRQRTDFACAAGACTGTTSADSRACSRSPGAVIGLTCAPRTCESCECTDPDPCEEDGTCTRLCNRFECSLFGTCDPIPEFTEEDCTRNTDGDICFECDDLSCECSDGVCEDAG